MKYIKIFILVFFVVLFFNIILVFPSFHGVKTLQKHCASKESFNYINTLGA